MFQSGSCIAICDTTIVMTDPKGVSLPAEFVERLKEMRVKGE